MPLHQSVTGIIKSFPIAVHFMGWESTTYELHRRGWDISMMENRTIRGYEMQVCFRHGRGEHALYALSQPMEARELMELTIRGTISQVENTCRSMHFRIVHFANDIRMVRLAPVSFGPLDFRAVDPTPQIMRFNANEEFSAKDFKFFKTAPEEAEELIVDPATVPELLDLILNQQKVTQAEIRQRMKSRENLKQYRAGEIGLEKRREVHAQLISIAV